MSKKLILVFVLVFFFFWFNLARAEVVINEVAWMGSIINGSANANAEWIELKNTGNSNVDLSGWTLVADDDTPNIILLDKCTNLIINAGGFLLLERTSDDSVPGISADCIYVGALGNTGEFLKLKNSLANIIDSIDIINDSWPAGDNDTKETMQRSDSNWITAIATPKSQNLVNSPPPADDSSNDDSSSPNNSNGSSASGSTPKVAEIQKIKTQIIGKTLGFVGLPLSLDATTLGLSGEQLRYGKYFWNFGDGDSKETEIMYSGKFTHIYFYPGDYVISLFYYSNYYLDIPDASSQINVKIVGTDISISRVGDEKDFFVELSNNTDYSADISNWILVSDVKSFIIPRNTILTSKKKMIISPKITNFLISDKDTLKLLTPEREIAFIYAASTPKVSQEPFLRNSKATSTISPNSNIQESSLNSEIEIPANGLQASVISSDLPENNSSNSYLPILSFFIFISAGAGSVYFIRRRKISSKEMNDFEILDE